MRDHHYQHTCVNYLAVYRIDCIYRNNFHISHAKYIPSITVRVSMCLYGLLFSPSFMTSACGVLVWTMRLMDLHGPTYTQKHRKIDPCLERYSTSCVLSQCWSRQHLFSRTGRRCIRQLWACRYKKFDWKLNPNKRSYIPASDLLPVRVGLGSDLLQPSHELDFHWAQLTGTIFLYFLQQSSHEHFLIYFHSNNLML